MSRSPLGLDARTAALRTARLARDAALPRRSDRAGHHRVFGLRDVLPFKKHQGKTLEDVMDEDIGYVTWLLENTDVQISDDAEREYHARLDPRRGRQASSRRE
jgi:hypothetical protein